VYRRLLIPVATPQEVEPLIRFGANLLSPGGEIRLLHVIPTVAMPELTRQWRASVNIVIPAHETGAALDLPVEPEVRAARDVPGEILDLAESHGTDGLLLVLRGDRRRGNPFVGHTATALLQHARCDVIIVNRLALTGARVTKILLPTFGPQPPHKALQLAEQLAVREGGIPIVSLLLSSRTGEGAAVGTAGERTTARGIPHRLTNVLLAPALFRRRRADPEILLAAAARERYGFMVVGEDGQRDTGPLLTRRFLEELFRTAPCPVLTLKG
jgi:nucleotide-binding universal stress UspA family protein